MELGERRGREVKFRESRGQEEAEAEGNREERLSQWRGGEG